VNNRRVRRKLLKSGDRIRMGDTELLFQLHPGASRKASGRQSVVVSRSKGFLLSANERVAIPATGGEIGRSRSCTFRLSDPLVSAHHARLEWRDGQCTLLDLGSTNGTFVNGVRVQHRHLRLGDTIRVGATSLIFQVLAARSQE
jgi:pSer/pThr/pTyr-binding forkhead associated (FHA) protein